MTAPCQPIPAFIHLAAHPLRWQLINELAVSDYRVRELVARTGHPQNLISYHLRALRESELITSTRSSHDGRDSYYHLDLQRCSEQLAAAGSAIHPGLQMQPRGAAPTPPPGTSVLFVCTGNSARSAIAEALLRHHTHGRLQVTSAGTRPRNHMHPNTARVLQREYGIDIAGQLPRHLDDFDTAEFTIVITLCDKARETCPHFDGHSRHIHWSIPDPSTADSAESYPAFKRTAININTRIHYLQAVVGDRS
ncbi:arsenate reductase/protein-tyrosine-phosphatase family protein [Mycobacteroides stephanolepidis]|nr:ArsR family transcriptional regulator [[Mycobacterium] stephanolepidis]